MAIANEASAEMRKYLVEFGLTPASAAKVPGKGQDPDEDARRFLFGGSDNDDDEGQGGQVVPLFG